MSNLVSSSRKLLQNINLYGLTWSNIYSIQTRLKNTCCPYHKSPCTFQEDQSKGVMAKIHYRTRNKEVFNYDIWCIRRPSQKYKVLNLNHKFVMGTDDFVHVDGDKIFCTGKIAQHYVPEETIRHCNNTVFEKKDTTIGIFLLIFHSKFIKFFYYTQQNGINNFIQII